VLLALLPPILVQAQSFGNDTAGLTGQASEVGRWQYLWTQTEIVLRYARLVVWPSGQSIDHEVTWRAVPWSGLAPLALAVHACVLASAAVLWRQSHRLAALPIVWLYVTLAPESSIYPIDDAMFEHRMYLPLFGVSLAFALLLQRILTRRAALGVALALIIIAALSMTTVRRNLVWNTQESLWADALMKAPDKARPNMAVGWLAGNRGELELARRHLLRAVEIDDDYAMAWNNLGVVADRSGDPELAVRAYSEASRLYPNESILHSNRAAALRRLGRLDESEAAFLRALELDGGNRSARSGLAALREQRE